MNVAAYLTPKHAVVWIEKRATVRDALARLELSGYTAIPMLDANGRYAGTVTEGDLLRKLALTPNLRLADLEEIRLFEVSLRSKMIPVGIDAQVEELLERAFEQNFVPVVDDRGIFVGIVRRRAILEQYAGLLRERLHHGPAD